jgi:hypothetical protein
MDIFSGGLFMKKRSIHVGVALLLALAFVFIACEGPAGPAGPGGTDGTKWQDPGIILSADVTANELAFAFAVSDTVTIAAGAEMDIAGIVPAGKTLRIAGAASIDTDDLIVKNGGNLVVLDGGFLAATTAKTLTVEPTANVTVNNGGALGSAVAIGWTISSAADIILAKKIGGLEYSHGDTMANYGIINYADNAAYYTEVAADLAAAKGYTVANGIYYAGVALSSFASATMIPADKTLVVPTGTDVTFAAGAQVIEGNLIVFDNVVQNAGANAVTVNGSLTIGGEYAALNNKLLAVQSFAGTGTITIGTLTIASSTGDTSFAIDADVTADTVEIESSAGETVTVQVDGKLTITEALTVTGVNSTDAIIIDSTTSDTPFGQIVLKAGCVSTEAAVPATPTYHNLPIAIAAAHTVGDTDEVYTWDTSDWDN